MEKLLVMGGSYFIGRHVVDMHKDDYDVYVLNRGNHPIKDVKITELKADRNDERQLEKALDGHHFDYVIDISGFDRPQAERLLDNLETASLKRYVYISSGAVYDIHKNSVPFDENDTLGGESPFGDYATNKIEAETFLRNQLHSEQLIVFRPPFVYGEDNYIKRERLMFHLIENDLPVYVPSSNNVVQFVYVRDLAAYCKMALEGVIPGGTYNVGDSFPFTFEEWVKRCGETMSIVPNIVFVDPEALGENVLHFFPFFDYDNVLSVRKLRRFTTLETPLEKGLKAAYEDYVSILHDFSLPKRMKDARKRIAAELGP